MAIALVNQWTLGSIGSDGVDPVAIANATGHWLAAFVVAGSNYGQKPVFNLADTSHNWWINASHLLASFNAVIGAAEIEMWIAPNAREALLACAGSSWPSQATLGIVAEFSGMPNFASITVSTSNSTASGTSLAMSGSAAAASYSFAMLAVSGLGSIPTVSGPGAGWANLTPQITASGTADATAQVLYAAFATNSAGSVSASWTSTLAALSGLLVSFAQSPAAPSQPNPNWPALKFEAALGFQPGEISGIPVYTDLTTRMISGTGESLFTAGRGRDYELTNPSAGTLEILLNNQDGALNPVNASSGLYPDWTLGLPVRLSAVWNSVTYGVASGYVTSLPQTWNAPFSGQWGWVKLRADDGISVLSNIELPSALGGEILTDQPYAYFPLGENYNSPAGEPFDNASRTNLKAAYGYNGVGVSNFLATGQSLNIAGDPGSGIGVTDFSGISQNVLPGARYLDYDIPQPSAGGMTLECVAVISQPPSGAGQTAYLDVMALTAPAGNYVVAGAPPSAQRDWRIGLVVTQENAVNGQYALIVQDYAGHQSVTAATAAINMTDGAAHHHAVTLFWESPSWVAAYFIDGVQIGVLVSSGVAEFTDVTGIMIGPALGPYGVINPSGFNYAIGQVAYTATTLTPSRIAAHATAALTAWTGDPVTKRFARYLTWSGLGLPRAADLGSVNPLIGNADQIQGSACIDAVSALTVGEGGQVYCDAQGVTWYRSRMGTYNQAVTWTFGDNVAGGEIPYDPSSEFGFDVSFLYNQTSSQRTVSTGEFLVISTGGQSSDVPTQSTAATAQEADLASEQAYFPRGPLVQGIETTSDQDAYDRASWSLALYRQPQIRASQLVLVPSANTAVWPAALGTEQGDIVTVNRRPLGAVAYSVTCVVQKVEHQVGPGKWVTTLTLSPYYLASAVLQCDVAGFDTVASNTLGW